MLDLAAEQLAFFNVTIYDADIDLNSGDAIIGLLILQHLQVDIRTLLERKNVRSVVDNVINDARSNGLPVELPKELKAFVKSNLNVFCTPLSAGPPTGGPPLQTTLHKNAKPARPCRVTKLF